MQDRFNHQEGIPSAFHQERQEREPAVNTNPPDQQVYLIPRQRPQGVLQWGYFVIMFPFRFVYSTLYDLVRFIGMFIAENSVELLMKLSAILS